MRYGKDDFFAVRPYTNRCLVHLKVNGVSIKDRVYRGGVDGLTQALKLQKRHIAESATPDDLRIKPMDTGVDERSNTGYIGIYDSKDNDGDYYFVVRYRDIANTKVRTLTLSYGGYRRNAVLKEAVERRNELAEDFNKAAELYNFLIYKQVAEFADLEEQTLSPQLQKLKRVDMDTWLDSISIAGIDKMKVL